MLQHILKAALSPWDPLKFQFFLDVAVKHHTTGSHAGPGQAGRGMNIQTWFNAWKGIGYSIQNQSALKAKVTST